MGNLIRLRDLDPEALDEFEVETFEPLRHHRRSDDERGDKQRTLQMKNVLREKYGEADEARPVSRRSRKRNAQRVREGFETSGIFSGGSFIAGDGITTTPYGSFQTRTQRDIERGNSEPVLEFGPVVSKMVGTDGVRDSGLTSGDNRTER